MGKYIALLRGINVGGKNKISMAELKIIFSEHGFQDVSTYINSGNVIFSTDNKNETELKNKCEELIKERFSLDIPVTIISAMDLVKAMENAPNWWDIDKLSINNAIFVIPPATSQELIEQIGVSKPEYEQISHFGQVIFWSAPIKTYSKTKWSKVYKSITVRNANTAKKLLGLIK